MNGMNLYAHYTQQWVNRRSKRACLAGHHSKYTYYYRQSSTRWKNNHSELVGKIVFGDTYRGNKPPVIVVTQTGRIIG